MFTLLTCTLSIGNFDVARFLKQFWWAILLAVILIAVGGFVVWANAAAPPSPVALSALVGDERVAVNSGSPYWTFQPVAEGGLPIGLIFYPGGRVDARAYAPLARAVAEAGYLTVIVPMPLNLAVFDLNAADRVRADFPLITLWAIGGHSLGGAMAAQYACSHPATVQGLIFTASYPPCDLASSSIRVTSIYGTLDGLASASQVEASAAQLPPNTTFVRLDGGNHAQFGDYGDQAGDNPATLPRDDQRTQTVAAIVTLLSSLTPP